MTERQPRGGREASGVSEGSIRIEIARSFAEVEPLADEWRHIAGPSGFAPEDYRAASEWTAGFLRPHVIAVREGAVVRLVVGAILRRASLPIKLGYRSLWAPLRRCLELEPGAIVGTLDDAGARAVIAALQEALRRGEADLAIFRQISSSSPLFHLVRKAAPRWCRDGAPIANVRWILPVPDSPETPLPLSTHTRRLGRYYTNRLRRKYGERLRIEVLSMPEDFERVMRDLETVAAKTYQRKLGVGFVDDELTRRRVRHEMKRGRFRAFLLSIDGRPCAFWSGLRFGETYFAEQTGYDPEFHADHVGKVLLTWKLEEIRREGGIRRVDFGFGDATYKTHYATVSTEEAIVLLFAPKARSLLLNATRTVVQATNQAFKSAANRLQVLDAVRTRARRRLLARKPGGPEPAEERLDEHGDAEVER